MRSGGGLNFIVPSALRTPTTMTSSSLRIGESLFFFKQKTAYEFSEYDWSSDVCSSDRRFFFFKQKTAYEISECDWSSDVCSSDPPVTFRNLVCRLLLVTGGSEEHTSELQSH